jgi:hypothetical protein
MNITTENIAAYYQLPIVHINQRYKDWVYTGNSLGSFLTPLDVIGADGSRYVVYELDQENAERWMLSMGLPPHLVPTQEYQPRAEIEPADYSTGLGRAS